MTGKVQQHMLYRLRESGQWYAGCGWYWGCHSETVRVMDSLVRKGLVTRTFEPTRTVYRLNVK